MRGGRKNLKRAVTEPIVTQQQGQSIMQVVNLRGSNLIEVMDAKGQKLLAFFQQRSFIVVDESGREEAAESGRKVGGIVTQVLYHDQVRQLQKSPEWPQIFRFIPKEDSKPQLQSNASQNDYESSSGDDGLPPLEVNTNRLNPMGSHADTDSNSDSDSDSDSDTKS
ncbi:hypothetical protein F511_38885 [Dorcoceras hygrometricum]|uniref:Uncharacterized protein n=1 Tax=Dorcoceras hygrometricum TaxID=472368 RepID=A0A2Z7B694_9LAMI|nr:hypothetical protein F511_38885 [Dorcoceras hygrometricum]